MNGEPEEKPSKIDPQSVDPKLGQARTFVRRLQAAAVALNDLAIEARLEGFVVVLPVEPILGGDPNNTTVRPHLYLHVK